MPYINRLRRSDYEEYTKVNMDIETPGDLTYLITSLLLKYKSQHDLSFDNALEPCIGALECAKLEFYRRVLAPYEDTKIGQNGDVYLTIPSHDQQLSPRNREVYDGIYGK